MHLQEIVGEITSVYIAFEVFPRRKGSSTHIASMVAALADAAPRVLLICLGVPGMPSIQQDERITIIRCLTPHANMLKRARGFADFTGEILEEIGKNVKICVFRDPWGGCSAFGTRYSFPTLFEVNALPSFELAYTYPGVRRNAPLMEKIRDLERSCLKGSTAVTTVSSVTRDALVNMGIDGEKICVIPNAVSDLFFQNAVDESEGIENTYEDWFGYFGSLHTWQGIEVAVDAFSLISSGYPDARMLIVTGGQKKNLKLLRKRVSKKNLANRIKINAPVNQDQLAVMIGKLQFTVAPLLDTLRNSVQGCCPIKILESMAASVPVAASDLRVTRSIISDRINGLLFRPSDPRSLALSMTALFDDKKFRKSLGRMASEFVKRDYHTTTIHDKLKRCFHTIMI